MSSLRDGRLENGIQLLTSLKQIYVLPPHGVSIWSDGIAELAPQIDVGYIVTLTENLKLERDVLDRLRRDHCKQLELVRFCPGYAWLFHPTEGSWWPSPRPTSNWLEHMPEPMLPGTLYL